VHGFLGTPEDFSLILWPEPSWQHDPRDLWLDLGSLAGTGLELDADWLSLSGERLSAGIAGRKRPTVLVGYSMGGRLALQAAADRSLWPCLKGLVLVSTHPGLKDSAERERRLASDLAWAERFERDTWAKVVEDWNKQGILSRPQGLGGSLPLPERHEGRINRRLLALSLVVWSLGRQRSALEAPEFNTGQWPFPVLLITGETDEKFTSLAREWEAKGQSSGGSIRHVAIPSAGHRVPWDRPVEFRAVVQDFLSCLSTSGSDSWHNQV
jgi:2-succinyl-6-hydroxy-2,4-cyclohexadiene-1-carboxylate synthase